MLFLFFWSIFFGKIFFLFFFDGELVLLFFWEKLIGGFFLLFSLFLMFFQLKLSIFSNLWGLFFEMFFLNWFFGGFLSKKPFLGGILIIGESYWLEVLGPKGFISLLLNFFSFSSLRANFFMSSIFIFVVSLVFILVLPISL
jgi:hypothetical protein